MKFIINTLWIILLLQACSTSNSGVKNEANMIAGKIISANATSLPSGAVVYVRLDDISLMDASSVTIAKQTITDASTFPISFHFAYNPKDIKSNARYTLTVKIQKGDKLLYITDTFIPLFGDGSLKNLQNLKVPVKQIQ